MLLIAWNWGAKAGLFYAGTNALCLIWCWFRLPETKARSFGEIDLLFENHVPARKFRTTKADRELSTVDIGLVANRICRICSCQLGQARGSATRARIRSRREEWEGQLRRVRLITVSVRVSAASSKDQR